MVRVLLCKATEEVRAKLPPSESQAARDGDESCGRLMRDFLEVLTSAKMVSLVEEFRNRYPSRIVIFGLPSLLETLDVSAFSPYTDTLLLVVEKGVAEIDDPALARQIVKGHTPVLGTVLNKSGCAGLSPKAIKRMLVT